MTDDRSSLVMEAQVKATADAVEDISMRVSSIDRTLRGNGTKGLFTRHELLERRMCTMEDFAQEIKAMRMWLVTGVCALLGSVVWNAVQLVLKSP